MIEVEEKEKLSGISPILEIRDLDVSFFTRRGEVKAIRNLNFALNKGEILGIVGESGCGKSVTSLSIVDLLPQGIGVVRNGEIIFDGKNLTDLYKKEFKIINDRKVKLNRLGMRKIQNKIQSARGDISIIFQDPLTSLDPLYKIKAQMLESIIYNNYKTMAQRLLDKNKIRTSDSSMLSELNSESTTDFLNDVEAKYGKDGFYQELLYIINMNYSEYDKKIRILKAINSSDLSISDIKQLESILTKPKVYKKPRNSKKKSLFQTKDPIVREGLLFSIELFDFINLPNPEKILDSYPHELSGGMKQRVMIALAVANNPQIIIADEPTTALDVTTQHQILYLLKNLNTKLGLSMIFITHDLGVMSVMADRIAVMYAGNICEIGPTETVFRSPRHPYTVGLLKCVPGVSQDEGKLYTIPGQVPDLINPPHGCPFADRCSFAFETCFAETPPMFFENGRGVSCWLYGGEKNE